jgi:hypothetical protein
MKVYRYTRLDRLYQDTAALKQSIQLTYQESDSKNIAGLVLLHSFDANVVSSDIGPQNRESVFPLSIKLKKKLKIIF